MSLSNCKIAAFYSFLAAIQAGLVDFQGLFLWKTLKPFPQKILEDAHAKKDENSFIFFSLKCDGFFGLL